MRVFKVFLLLKCIRSEKIRSSISRILLKSFMNIYVKELMSESDYGYIFIAAQKI
jgi:hypothetical protein